MNKIYFWTLGIILIVLLSWFSIFAVGEKQAALVFDSGKLVRVIDVPGDYFLLPFMQSVKKLDLRVQTTEVPVPQMFTDSAHNRLMATPWFRWQIVDINKFVTATDADLTKVTSPLLMKVVANAGDVVAQHRSSSVLEGSLNAGNLIVGSMSQQASMLGVKIIDAGLGDITLPEKESGSILKKMRIDAEKNAGQVREQGKAQAAGILAQGKLDSQETLAIAKQQAAMIIAETDADAATITEKAYRHNPRFYIFWGSLEAYKAGFKGRKVVVLPKDSSFFKYFNTPDAAVK